MELPAKTIVIVIVLAVVLAALMAFFFQSSGSSLTRADAERIFSSQCVTYGQRQCEWKVTYEEEFGEYLSACRTLYGNERDSFSCLYTLCNRCFETSDVKCAGLCNICNGHDAVGVERQSCCIRYQAECSGSDVDCSAACG